MGKPGNAVCPKGVEMRAGWKLTRFSMFLTGLILGATMGIIVPDERLQVLPLAGLAAAIGGYEAYRKAKAQRVFRALLAAAGYFLILFVILRGLDLVFGLVFNRPPIGP